MFQVIKGEKVKHNRKFSLWAGVAAFGLFLTACSGGGGGGSEGSNGGDGGTNDAPAADVEQVLNYVPGFFPVSLDVHEFPSEEGVQVAVQQVLEPLVNFDGEEATPLLAESWEYVTETELTFTLRDDVEFSDGTPFTSADVKASLDRLIDLDQSLAPLFSAVTETRADDDHTFTIVTDKPVGTLVGSMSLVFIGTEDGVNSDDYWLKPTGTGPFVVEDYVADDHVTLKRNENYWGEESTLETLNILNVPETAARVTGLQTGEIDVVSSIPPDQVSNIDGVDGIQFDQEDSFLYYFIWFNHDHEPLDDVRVRQAMWHAVDVNSIVNDLFGDGAEVAGAPIPGAAFGATDLDQAEYDVELAKELLADAGYPDGFEVDIQWPAAGGPNIKALAQAFISGWADAGITVNPLEKERAKWLEDFGALEWDLNLQTNTTNTGDADFTLNRLYTCAAERLGYCNPELDELLTEANQSLDQDERLEIYADAIDIMWEDVVGLFPVDIKANIAYNEKVAGLELPATNRPYFSTVYLTE